MDSGHYKKKYETVTTLGIIGIVISIVWCFTGNRKKFSVKQSLTSIELCNILVLISNEVYPIMIELSHLIYTMKKSLNHNSDEFTRDVEVILSHGEFKDKIIQAQRRILDNFDIDEKYFEKLIINRSKSDKQIGKLKLGLESMYKDAIRGIYPILPHLGTLEEFTSKYPEYTREHTLCLLKALNKEKEKRFAHIVEELGDPLAYTTDHPIMGSLPSEKLSEKLQEANILSENHIVGVDEDKRLFTHAIALFSREESFLSKRLEIEQEHSDNIFNIIVNINR